MAVADVTEQGTLAFTIETRILRELGERLVKAPEVAMVELIKNAYDADARECKIVIEAGQTITVADDGRGMTLSEFTSGWMRVGTSSKEAQQISAMYGRRITGEKGIGRFAVRFLGRKLKLRSIARVDDNERTELTADFDWTSFDEHEDLASIRVPYRLRRVENTAPTGTELTITALRSHVQSLDLRKVRTEAVGMLSPIRSMMRNVSQRDDREVLRNNTDPGFLLQIRGADTEDSVDDVAATILDLYELRGTLTLAGNRLEVTVYRHGTPEPYTRIVDTFDNTIGSLWADVRFFPRRPGQFAGAPIDGRLAYSWIRRNSGVAVFDRAFRVLPYGTEGDDWLMLTADAARNRRDPRSPFAQKHFAMTAEEAKFPALNWMLRLPESLQLVGVVQVESARGRPHEATTGSLVPSADREGFVANAAFTELQSLIRGLVEAIAACDRQIQRAEEVADEKRMLAALRRETRAAVAAVQSNSGIKAADKTRIVAYLQRTERYATNQERRVGERTRQLEVMSLLGVVAGFMTHEFGAALHELKQAHSRLASLRGHSFDREVAALASHIDRLEDFAKYSRAYVDASRGLPDAPYRARPRIQQVVRIFGKFATDRGIDVEVSVESDVVAPLVPVALYNGVVLNIFTNALKALMARIGRQPRRVAFRAWNEAGWHLLEVSDTGIGIPSALRDRIFEPLFTTTSNGGDALGSGMGLGLSLVRRAVGAFGGTVEVVDAPPGFATCIRVRLPLEATR
jgi:signal transduction histidine kinase